MRRIVLLVLVLSGIGVFAAGGALVTFGVPWTTARSAPTGEVVFTRSLQKPKRADLYVMAADGSHPRLLARDAAQPAASPDGRRIAFVRGRAIWIMQRDGSAQRQLTKGFPDSGPAWASDDRTLYFSRWQQKYGSAIVSIHADGTHLRVVVGASDTGHFHCQSDPAPSPLGRVIALADSQDCEHDPYTWTIRKVSAAGRELRIRSEQSSYDPAWSPDGRRLAYGHLDWNTLDGGGIASSGIYVSSPDGSQARRVVPGAWPWGPAWSPDGTWIAYEAEGIRLVQVDGTARRTLTKTGAEPTWLP